MDFLQEYLEKYKNNLFNSKDKINNRSFFLEIARQIIIYFDLNDYVNDINIINKLAFNFDGYYDGRNIIICDCHEDEAILLYYYKMFNIFFHELQHAIQAKLIDKYNWYYSNLPINYNLTLNQQKEIEKAKIIGISNAELFSHKLFYLLKHDLFPSEHEANYYSYVNTYKVLFLMLPELRKILEYQYSLNTLKLLLKDYKIDKSGTIISPFEQSFINRASLRKIILPDDDIFSDLEKMILGLPISEDTYSKINNSIVSEVVSSDVKKYILNL